MLNPGGGIGEFEQQIIDYPWPPMPLRVWLSNHHRPRIPTIDMSETDAASITAYITALVKSAQQVNPPADESVDTEDTPPPKFDRPVPDEDADAMEVDDGTLNRKYCLNCGD